jgi:hypothetical protein
VVYLALRGSNLGEDGHKGPDQVQETDCCCHKNEEEARGRGKVSGSVHLPHSPLILEGRKDSALVVLKRKDRKS